MITQDPKLKSEFISKSNRSHKNSPRTGIKHHLIHSSNRKASIDPKIHETDVKNAKYRKLMHGYESNSQSPSQNGKCINLI